MKTIAIIVCILLALGVLAFIGLHLVAYLQLFASGIILKRKLSRDGRTSTRQEARSLIAQGKGCIVVDGPTLGWNVARVWWAPWHPLPSPPVDEDSEHICSIEDQKNYEGLIDPVTGVARIICPFLFSERLRPYLSRNFGIEECPFIFTGGVMFQRAIEKKKAEQDVHGNTH
jgi:hypothetical protein